MRPNAGETSVAEQTTQKSLDDMRLSSHSFALWRRPLSYLIWPVQVMSKLAANNILLSLWLRPLLPEARDQRAAVV